MSAAVARARPCSTRPARRRFNRIIDHLNERHLWGFPLRISADGQKLPLVPWKAFQARPPTAAEIARWIRDFPDAGAGIPTVSFIVVDADSPDAIEWLELRGMPETVLVRTRRGLHYYFKYPVGLQVSNSAGVLVPGVDIRGTGGMVVAAGTCCPDGFVYYYDRGHGLGEVAIGTAPDWLINWLIEKAPRRQVAAVLVEPREYTGKIGRWARKVIDTELAILAAAGNGTRNSTLARVSFKLGQLVGGGEADAGELRAALGAVASTWKDERIKSADTIARAFNEGQAHPRRRRQPRFKRRNPWAYTPGLEGEFDGAETSDG